jgi:hypothetical protein
MPYQGVANLKPTSMTMTSPKKLALLLDRLPEKVRSVKYMRVNANKDTQAARRIVQRWRRPKNPISPLAPLATSAQADFIIGFPLDKQRHIDF